MVQGAGGGPPLRARPTATPPPPPPSPTPTPHPGTATGAGHERSGVWWAAEGKNSWIRSAWDRNRLLGARVADQSSVLHVSGALTCPSLSVSLQRTHRLPKEMTPVEPSAFAAQLIARLEKLKREQDTMSSLEERLQQIQEVR